MKPGLRSYFTRPLFTVLFLGFSSGLPLALTASTLGAWLFESHVDKTSIGLFAAVATPYTLKFLWSPIMDSLPVPVLSRMFGKRRGWILATQLGLVAAFLLMSFTRPDINPFATAMAAVLVAFLSASQDIVIDAYRVDILTPQEQGEGAAMTQLGYRLGMLLSGAGALKFAMHMSWQKTYWVMAAFMGIGILTTLLAREPAAPQEMGLAPRKFLPWFRESVIAPFANFMRHPSWWMILVFVVTYRLADAFIGIMTSPFLLDIGFTKDDIANIVKIYGWTATIIGTFVGGTLTARLGPLRMMFTAGLLHAATNLLYVLQAQMGTNIAVLALGTALENFTGGLAAAAFVAYLSNLTNVHYTATQYALLSSLAALGRTLLATPAGWVAKHLGWSMFFLLSALLALPGLLLLVMLNKRLAFQNRQS
jgi:PAT family beta-lactamase induction signal transducer AmpG